MKYIIADPDSQNSTDLRKILDSYKIFDFQGHFATLEATEKSLHGEPPDIAFIRMEKIELNAFKLSKMIRALNPSLKVVCLSSSKEYAVEAFELQATGFLLLPIKAEKLRCLLRRIVKISI